MRDDELSMFRQLDTNTHANKWFMPLVWVGKMIGDGVEKNYIKPPTATALLDEVLKIRGNLQTLLSYDWLSVPLVYTQTVTIATYFYFAAALIGAQWIMPESREMFLKTYKTPPGEYSKLDMLFPLFVVIQFAFFIGLEMEEGFFVTENDIVKNQKYIQLLCSYPCALVTIIIRVRIYQTLCMTLSQGGPKRTFLRS